MKLFPFVFAQHSGLACGAALLFLVGGLLAIPVVKRGTTILTWLPVVLFRMVGRMLGRQPSITRLWSVIFGFNGTVMLLYMASGIHAAIPASISMVTGYNIAAILLLAGQSREFGDLAVSPGDGWVPARWAAGLCGLAVLILELPCFWYAIAMGMRLGQEIAAGETTYVQGVAPRIRAYVTVILPALLVSAVCEAIAIRGMAGSPPDEIPPQGSGSRDQGSGPHPTACRTGGLGWPDP